MHNNGTNRLWQPSRPAVINPTAPKERWDLTIQHNGIHVAVLIDESPIMAPRVLTAQEASELGVNLLRAGAIFGFIQSQAAAQAGGVDTPGHELT